MAFPEKKQSLSEADEIDPHFSALIEVALSLMEIAPSLHEAARRNMARLVAKGDEAELFRRIEDARARKERLSAWLEAQDSATPAASDLLGKEPVDNRALPVIETGGKLWGFLRRLVQQSDWNGTEWAQNIVRATSQISDLGRSAIVDERPVAAACGYFEDALRSADFATAPSEIKGAIFAEAANLYVIWGVAKDSYEAIGRSLPMYRQAVRSLTGPHTLVTLHHVQLNRGIALELYDGKIKHKLFSRFSDDVSEVKSYIEGYSAKVPSKETSRRMGLILKNLKARDHFNRSFRQPSSGVITSRYSDFGELIPSGQDDDLSYQVKLCVTEIDA